jgi:tetratricopeptide (TPR) repeat protein
MTESTTGSYKQAFDQANEMIAAGEFQLALSQIEAILEVHAGDAKTHFLKAVALRRLGNHEQAINILRKLSQSTDGVAPIHQELGYALFAVGRIDDAVEALRNAVAIDPQLAASWKLLGELLYREEDEEEAEEAFRRQMAASHRHPGIVKALELIQQERYGMAEGICRDYLQRNPDDVTVMRLLAEIGIKLGVRDDPEILLEQCLKLAPDYHFARNTYANALGKANKYQQALGEIDYLEKVEPGNLSHGVLAASILVMIGAYEDAARRYESILAKVPQHAQLQNSYGHTLKTLGRQKEAVAAYRKAISLKDNLGDAYFNLANLKTFTFDPEEVEKMRAVISGSDNSASDYFHLCFALGKALEDLHKYDEAFNYYEKGNRAKCRQAGYRADETHGETQALITECRPALFENTSAQGCQASDPIFIVGLPRSGSTLLEQILASHSQVDGTSELREMISIARRLSGKRNKDDVSKYPEILWHLSESERLQLGEEYMERTRIQRQGAPFFIDKMPNNFQHVGLISLVLPNAKIIDARRHPMATCFSGYKQLFAAGQTFTYSQSDIAQYYIDYVALMEHWDSVLPGKVLRVKYENVIDNTEREVRRLLDYCGLPFEAECLAFHNTERAIRTASSEQVRQPIYTGAVEQWRNFEVNLTEMKAMLEPLIAAHEHC